MFCSVGWIRPDAFSFRISFCFLMADDRISPTVSQAFQHESTKEKSFGSIAATPAAGKGKPKALQFAQQSVFQSDLGPFLGGTNEECIGHLFFFPAIINKPDPDPWGTPRPAAAKATLIHHLAVRAKNKKMQPRAVHGRPINIIWGKRPLKKGVRFKKQCRRCKVEIQSTEPARPSR